MRSKKNQNALNIIITFLVLSLMFIFLALSNFRIFQKRTSNISILEQLEEKALELEEKKDHLEQELENIYSPDYLERVAREQLRLVKPGERVVIIQIQETQEEEQEEESSFWDFDWLFR